MNRMFLTLATLAATFTLSQAAQAEKPSGKQSVIFGQTPKAQGFTRNGEQGIGLFGPAGGTRTQRSSAQLRTAQRIMAQRFAAQQYGTQQYSAQQYGTQSFGVPAYQGASAYSSTYRPQLQYNLQVPYPSQQYGYSYSYSEDGDLSVRRVIMGNPANSFVPAAAFGFGPGAIFGW
jgi:hypothetical protein